MSDYPVIPELRPALKELVANRMATVLSRAEFELQDWINEVRALAQAATMDGSFSTALDAYKVLGRHMGANIDGSPQTASQHVHFHGSEGEPVKEATREEIANRLAHIRQQQAEAEQSNVNELLE